ncbi:MAG TPA: helix-turn-helix domain-containing protein [Hyphomonadaceae bacterium]|nr:helix-turn-helix domain-containing protein [Hyphomonadaceae bacterium]
MPDTAERPNQRRRTRKALLDAAAQLMRENRKLTLEEVAEAALVSRATAYRYFPSIETLMTEATLDLAIPGPDEVLKNAPGDATGRMEKVDAAFETMMAANETGLRMMLSQSLQRDLSPEGGDKIPKRQNRRSPMIEAALAPVRKDFRPADLKLLEQALALVIGTEAMIVFKDVLQVSDAEARKVRRWAIRALIEAARK